MIHLPIRIPKTLPPGAKKVLAVVAHADDEVLGPGATLARHVAVGDYVQVLIIADCRCARDPSHTPALSEEAVASLEVLGVASVSFLAYRAMTLGLGDNLNRDVSAAIAQYQPEVVYTHHCGDLNSDHRAVSEAVMVAMRPAGRAHRLLFFETPSSTEWAVGMGGFQPNYFVDVTDHLDRKLDAMGCYKAELRALPHPRSIDMLKARALYWGQVAGCLHAEAFQLVREVRR